MLLLVPHPSETLWVAATAVPERATVWGVELALSVIATVPLSEPAAVGAKNTRMLHCAPTAKDVPQLLLCEKLLLAVTLLMVIAVEPVLVNVTDLEGLVVPTVWLVKVRLVGDREAEVVAAPVPVRLTVWALVLALSVMDSSPVRVPAAVGVKVTKIAHCAPTASEEPQLLVWEKSPLAVMPLMPMAVVPVFVKLTSCVALVPIAWLAKVKRVADKVSEVVPVPEEAVAPVPVRFTVWALVLALLVIDNSPKRFPAAVGVNVTEIVHCPPAGRDEPQLLVWEKSRLAAILPIWRRLRRAFDKVTI